MGAKTSSRREQQANNNNGIIMAEPKKAIENFCQQNFAMWRVGGGGQRPSFHVYNTVSEPQACDIEKVPDLARGGGLISQQKKYLSIT